MLKLTGLLQKKRHTKWQNVASVSVRRALPPQVQIIVRPPPRCPSHHPLRPSRSLVRLAGSHRATLLCRPAFCATLPDGCYLWRGLGRSPNPRSRRSASGPRASRAVAQPHDISRSEAHHPIFRHRTNHIRGHKLSMIASRRREDRFMRLRHRTRGPRSRRGASGPRVGAVPQTPPKITSTRQGSTKAGRHNSWRGTLPSERCVWVIFTDLATSSIP